MGKGMVVIGDADSRVPSPSSPEHAAEEYFVNRTLAGDWAPRPPIEKWMPDQRERFLTELRRLEDERASQSEAAVQQASERT